MGIRSYAIVRDADGFVLGILGWDGESAFDAGDGNSLVPAEGHAVVGATYRNGKFESPDSDEGAQV